MGNIRKNYSPAFKAEVVLELLREEKSIAEISSEYKVHTTQLRRWREQALSNLPQLFTKQEQWGKDKAKYEVKIDELYTEIGRLSTQLAWLKKKGMSLTRSERLALLDMYNNRELPLYIQAKLLSLNRSGLYYKPVPISEASLALRHRIDEIYTRWPFYGTRRITAILEHEGYTVNRKAVQRHMRELGLFAICPGPNLSKRNMQHKVYPYLLRGLSITAPDQVWGTDITYIRLAKGWMYLVAILDWYSRFVVAWELSDTLEAGFVKATVARAFERAIPGILNSDQGSQFTCDEYIQLVSSSGVKISMDGRGRAFDNIFTERLWRSVKYEEVYLHDYLSPRDARIGISRYFELYNYSRPHQALNYCTPFDVYSGRTAGLALRV